MSVTNGLESLPEPLRRLSGNHVRHIPAIAGRPARVVIELAPVIVNEVLTLTGVDWARQYLHQRTKE